MNQAWKKANLAKVLGLQAAGFEDDRTLLGLNLVHVFRRALRSG